MKFIFLMVLILSALPAMASYSFQIGEEIKLQDTFWRRLNDGSGRSCQLQFLSSVVVEKVSSEEILVRYSSDRLDHPSNCLPGTILSFEPHYLDSHRDHFNQYKSKKMALTKIKQGLSISSMGQYEKGDEFNISIWRWAVVEEAIGSFREGDLCRVWDPGYIKLEGFYEAQKSALFIYKNSGESPRECPENTLFFESL